MGLKFHQKALNIQENVKCNPLEYGTTYINLDETYREMKNYSIALVYFQKGLKIYAEKSPKAHPDLAVVYHSMAEVYVLSQQYNLTIEYAQHAVDIEQEKFPSAHPHLLDYRTTLEKIQKRLRDFFFFSLSLSQ
ncbi:unnamed protein product [Rotaria magnacalcarata]|uniref:Uncharacterized protein n=3 Tax=Rotaria magnacalcarata TaxID=392030 RepID=A0A816WT14_9BILA|nr:unnamed protein product [Rotaria magnacalcarata]CAF1522747.1 unnamed protein product [Rotaria magnacalcarata]CAF2138149.1 unnamed protein product [Rotaria magnacalcarata]CAF2225324.1 unnamed protein product [Rotaria magnacalcarata]CAF3878408.1 unnamed protein product [Rotaria magnacalcarata]